MLSALAKAGDEQHDLEQAIVRAKHLIAEEQVKRIANEEADAARLLAGETPHDPSAALKALERRLCAAKARAQRVKDVEEIPSLEAQLAEAEVEVQSHSGDLRVAHQMHGKNEDFRAFGNAWEAKRVAALKRRDALRERLATLQARLDALQAPAS
jgi:hypothetical protein